MWVGNRWANCHSNQSFQVKQRREGTLLWLHDGERCACTSVETHESNNHACAMMIYHQRYYVHHGWTVHLDCDMQRAQLSNSDVGRAKAPHSAIQPTMRSTRSRCTCCMRPFLAKQHWCRWCCHVCCHGRSRTGARDRSSGCRSWRCGVHSRRLRVSGFLFTTPSMLPCVKLNAQRLATTPKIMQMLPSSPSCPQVWAGRALAQILRTSLALCIQRRRCM